jgi:hypothetical protein
LPRCYNANTTSLIIFRAEGSHKMSTLVTYM